MLVNDVVVSDELNTYNLDGVETGYWTDEDKEDFADSHEEDGDWMDGDALASAGWGTDEDYGYYGDDFQATPSGGRPPLAAHPIKQIDPYPPNYNVGGCMYNYPMNEKSIALQEKILATKAILEAENFTGSTEDENPDPRLTEMMNDLLILEVFYFQDYRNLVNTHFVKESN